MKFFFLILALSFNLYMASAATVQSKAIRVKGTIIDKSTAAPLEFSTISLSDTSGKVVAVHTSDEKGMFALATIPAGEYLLKVSYVGYADVTQTVHVSAGQQDIDLGAINIEPDSKQLNEVVVTGRKPTIERQIDKLVVNVANTIAAENSTALELLKKAPGLSIDRDGNVTLNGQSVQVWVDNRPVQLSGPDLIALLNGTEGNSIDKIEIIDNPSSKYDAAGSGGIVNIKTKKNFIRGFNGNLRAGFQQYIEDVDGYYYGANGSANFNYRNDLLSSFVNYGIRQSNGFGSLTEEVKSDNGYSRYSSGLSKDYSTPQHVKAGIDLFLDKKNTIGVIGNYSTRRSKENDNTTAIIGQRNNPEETSEGIGCNNGAFHNASVNLNYTHLFGADDNHDLTLNADYIYNMNTPDQYSHTDFQLPVGVKDPKVFKSNSDQLTQVYSFKADYTRPLNKSMKIEAGGKIGYSKNNSEILRLDSLQNGWQKNRDYSSEFNYSEMISALYVNYSWQISEHWSAKAGLRWENTGAKGEWISSDSTTSQQYNDFFPTLFIGFNPSEKHQLGLSYTRRLERPNYWNLNPFRRYIGAYTYIEGNPQLSPSYSDNIRLSYTAFQFLNIGASFSYNQGMIVQIPVFDPIKGETGYVQGNFGYNYHTGIWASVSEFPLTKWWTLNLSLWAAYVINDDNTTVTKSWQFNPYLSTTVLLGKNWSAELEGWMSTPTIWGYYEISAQGSLNAGVKKNFWDNKASLSLYLDDIFNSQHSNVRMARNGTSSYNENSWDSRSIRVSFSWRFGNMGSPAKQRKVGQQDEANRLGSGGGAGQ